MNIQYYAKELQDKNELYDLIMNNSFGGVLLPVSYTHLWDIHLGDVLIWLVPERVK